MNKLTGIERISNILNHKSVDRIGLYEHFWGDTHRTWAGQGKIAPDAIMSDVFNHDMDECWALNLVADLDFVPRVIEETETTQVILDGNGAMLRRHKEHDTTPEHVGYKIESREDWLERIKPLLVPDPR